MAIVIPTWDRERAGQATLRWRAKAKNERLVFCIAGGDGKKRGALEAMLEGALCVPDAEIIGFVHDDVEIHEEGWDEKVYEFFELHSHVGMVGFGGALGLGLDDIYKRPYKLTQLARINFYSNMDHWEVHGFRTLVPKKVAVLDGFAQFMRLGGLAVEVWKEAIEDGMPPHHMYDAYAACWMAEQNLDTWVLPIRCAHHGGLTSTSSEYDQWLKEQGWDGDSEVHAVAHDVIYRRFRNILPLRVEK